MLEGWISVPLAANNRHQVRKFPLYLTSSVVIDIR